MQAAKIISWPISWKSCKFSITAGAFLHYRVIGFSCSSGHKCWCRQVQGAYPTSEGDSDDDSGGLKLVVSHSSCRLQDSSEVWQMAGKHSILPPCSTPRVDYSLGHSVDS